MQRDAGSFVCEGTFRHGGGGGTFTFSPSPEYVSALRALGYNGLDTERLFELAVHNVSRAYIKELDELGYHRLPARRIFGATPHPRRYALLIFRDYISARAISYSLDVNSGPTSKFTASLTGLCRGHFDKAGYGVLGHADQLVCSYRIHWVTEENTSKLPSVTQGLPAPLRG